MYVYSSPLYYQHHLRLHEAGNGRFVSRAEDHVETAWYSPVVFDARAQAQAK